MYEILSKIIDNLNSNQLEEIFTINSLNLQGFRIKGPSSTAKTQRMKTLLTNNSKLESILKKTAETYSSQKNRDYSWALVSTIDKNLIQKKIEESNICEVAYALIVANKLVLLKELLLTENDDKASIAQNKNTIKKTSESYKDESIVKDLREIINSLEDKNKDLNDSLKKLRGDVANLNQENENLKTRNNDIKDEQKKVKDNFIQLKELLEVTEDELKKNKENVLTLEKDVINAKLKIEKLNKLKVLFYGTNIYKRYLETKASSLENLIYDYVNCFEQIEDYKLYQKLVILSFTLNKAEIQELREKEIFNYFDDLYNVVFISSLEELNEYIAKVGRYYE